MEARAAELPGGRLHLQHGPIDLIIHAVGDPDAVARAHEGAWNRFRGVLQDLVGELRGVRAPIHPESPCALVGPVARRMWQACLPFADTFVTPMAAVAGAVADEICGFYRREGIVRASVNNGGDIALAMLPGERMRIAIVPDVTDALAPADPRRRLALEIPGQGPVRGLATSGWQGRSFSLGIADSVTVLAATAAEADAAATLIANAVNVVHPGIARRPACDMQMDSDLGDIPVTVHVPRLPADLVDAALAHGELKARQIIARGLAHAAVLTCQSQVRLAARRLHLDGLGRWQLGTPLAGLVVSEQGSSSCHGEST